LSYGRPAVCDSANHNAVEVGWCSPKSPPPSSWRSTGCPAPHRGGDPGRRTPEGRPGPAGLSGAPREDSPLPVRAIVFTRLSAEAAALRSRDDVTRHCEPSSQDEDEAIQGKKTQVSALDCPSFVFLGFAPRNDKRKQSCVNRIARSDAPIRPSNRCGALPETGRRMIPMVFAPDGAGIAWPSTPET